ncbi:MAG: cytochrome-c oxidase, cbb3-type subunit III [Chromatiales bacterium]|nr:cytochrome-c oxidase, cbb3-type subunit III [Chromatiales bacterium]
MANTTDKPKTGGAVQTTGHAWDGDIQEFNNPLPTWWIWAFYLTVAFAVIYWILYPAWPMGKGFTTGVSEVTFESGGKEVTTHWNTRARLAHEMQASDEAQRQREYLERVASADFNTIFGDADMMAFAQSTAKGIFGDNCAPCHGSGGAGVTALFPNLADDDWLWGGSVDDIQTTIQHGRRGYMPPFKQTFNEQQLADVTDYVLGLSGHQVDPEAAKRGQAIFQGETGGCYYCHLTDGTGRKSQGAANLTDAIWTMIDVPGAADMDAKRRLVSGVISNGVTRIMPPWDGRLSPEQIKLLSVYVHELGGGQ